MPKSINILCIFTSANKPFPFRFSSDSRTRNWSIYIRFFITLKGYRRKSSRSIKFIIIICVIAFIATSIRTPINIQTRRYSKTNCVIHTNKRIIARRKAPKKFFP